ncbi:MAG: hypothetical protein WCK51_06870 [Armatimonadota bacterium]
MERTTQRSATTFDIASMRLPRINVGDPAGLLKKDRLRNLTSSNSMMSKKMQRQMSQ